MQTQSPQQHPASTIGLWLLLLVLYILSFSNLWGQLPAPKYVTFQYDSEELVLGRIMADRIHRDLPQAAHLGRIQHEGTENYGYQMFIGQINRYLNTNGNFQELSGKELPQASFKPYLSQYGIQGDLYAFLFNRLGWTITGCQMFSLVMLAAVLSWLTLLYGRVLGGAFGACFFLTTCFTPWLALFARNLYWATFLWFLPIVAAFGMLLVPGKLSKVLSGLLLYLAFTLKCLAGYEYISTIILAAASVFILAALNPANNLPFKKATGMFFLVCGLGVAGFATALTAHANMIGPTIPQGLQSIYKNDVQRRTWGQAAAFATAKEGAGIQQSLQANPLTVARRYFFHWQNEKIVSVLLLGAIASLAWQLLRNRKIFAYNLGLLVVFAAAPASWYILAKGHSYIHTHINYVLQYFGFTASCLFVCVSSFKLLAPQERAHKRT